MEKPIRILHIVPNMQMGGLETFIMNLYRNIDRNKIQFDFLVHYKERKFFDDEIEKLGGKIYRLTLRDDNNIFKYIIELNKFYKRHPEYKIIHCHMSSIGFINFMVAKKNGIKNRIAHSHNNLTDKTLKGRIKRIMMLPYKFVSTENFACSKSAGMFLFGKKKFEVIPNAIEIEKFDYNEDIRKKIRKELKINSDTLVIGHVGRFNVQKNHIFLVEIFEQIVRKYDNSKLVLAGDGELREEIKKIVKTKNIEDKVIFLGNRKDICDIYQAFDLFVFPSLFEGLGITLIEAQISGLKCFTSKNVVAEEAKITENLDYVDLNKNSNQWCELILSKVDYQRKGQVENAKKYNFDVHVLAQKISDKYIKISEKG